MNARSYRVNLNISPLDYRVEKGLGQTSVSYHSEPFLVGNKLVLKIANSYTLTDMFTNKEHEFLKVQSEYEIPPTEIKSREDVYEFYKDALLGLNETYQAYKSQQPENSGLHNIKFSTIPIENYKREIDRVFSLLNRLN